MFVAFVLCKYLTLKQVNPFIQEVSMKPINLFLISLIEISISVAVNLFATALSA